MIPQTKTVEVASWEPYRSRAHTTFSLLYCRHRTMQMVEICSVTFLVYEPCFFSHSLLQYMQKELIVAISAFIGWHTPDGWAKPCARRGPVITGISNTQYTHGHSVRLTSFARRNCREFGQYYWNIQLSACHRVYAVPQCISPYHSMRVFFHRSFITLQFEFDCFSYCCRYFPVVKTISFRIHTIFDLQSEKASHSTWAILEVKW